MRVLLLAAVVLVCATGCKSNDSSTSSSPSTPTQTPANPTTSDTWTSTLPVGGSKFFSFRVGVYGTVNETLVNVTVGGAASDATLNAGIGVPSGTTCSLNTAGTLQVGAAPVTAVFQPGIVCVYLSDPGVLAAPANFTVQIDHP